MSSIGLDCKVVLMTSSKAEVVEWIRTRKDAAINRVPGIMDVCHKDLFGRIMNIWSRAHPDTYDFIPKTFVCPDELSLAEAYIASRIVPGKRKPFYIVKPSVGSQGAGVILIQDLQEIPDSTMEEEFILQEYITNPLTIDQKKFDLRIYLTIVGVEPMVGYIGREGMVRICTEPYEKPNRDNRDNTFIHLSNYSINKESDDFNKDLIGGSKRTLSSLFTELGEEHAQMLSTAIDEVVSKSIHALHPFVSNLCESYMAGSLDKTLGAQLF